MAGLETDVECDSLALYINIVSYFTSVSACGMCRVAAPQAAANTNRHALNNQSTSNMRHILMLVLQHGGISDFSSLQLLADGEHAQRCYVSSIQQSGRLS